MSQPNDWAWRPDGSERRPYSDGSWSLGVVPTAASTHTWAPWRDWRQLNGPRLLLVIAVASLLLLAGGAGIALGVTDGAGVLGSPKAGLYASPLPGGTLSAAATRRIAGTLDPAVVDINAVIATPSGPTDVAGTGMIVAASGDVITNNHVVEGATSVTVTADGGRHRYPAVFVGADPSADIALVRILGGSHFPTVRLGDSSRVQVGQGVLAFGNTLGLGGVASVTSGTVAALGRSITATSETGEDAEHLSGLIETDAPIAPGNSGGPLVDAGGQVIGMNTAAASPANTDGSSVAFALPINRVASIARAIEAGHNGHGVVIGLTAYLGIEGTTVRLVAPEPRRGVNIVQVEPETPASQAGLEPGDVITAFGSESTSSMSQLADLIARERPGTRVALTFRSGRLTETILVRLAASPAA